MNLRAGVSNIQSKYGPIEFMHMGAMESETASNCNS